MVMPSCCPSGACTTVASSPSLAFLDEDEVAIELNDSLGLSDIRLTYTGTEDDQIAWRISDRSGGDEGDGIPLDQSSIIITDAGEFGGLSEGEVRNNSITITYTYAGSTYSDTLIYISENVEDKCCQILEIDYDNMEYSGELVSKFERRSDVPGLRVFLEEPK